MKRLHIYAQPSNHDEAYIVGNRAALIALRDAIETAITSMPDAGTNSVADVKDCFTSDGEGYHLIIICESNNETWEKLQLPYTSPMMCTGDSPFTLIGGDRYRKLFGK